MIEKMAFVAFERYIDRTRPILLGLSGGPDSMALLYLLQKWDKSLQLHIVHSDHGWREESKQEAIELQAIAGQLSLPFHTTRFDVSCYSGNLEAEARSDRIAFFQHIAQKVGAQAILLGHNSDDQTETIFKRFLEGAAICHLSGMRSISYIENLKIIRPLLEISKREILGWLEAEEISYFVDVTNSNTRFLRARMRHEIFPYLQKTFGKEFHNAICAIGEDASRMRSYFDTKLTPYLMNPVTGPFGILLDLSDCPLQEPLEIRELLRRMQEMYNFSLSRSQLDLACAFFETSAANKWLEAKNKKVYIDRKRIFLVESSFEQKLCPMILQEGENICGSWKITVTPGCGEIKNSWVDVWKGSCSTVLPRREYWIQNFVPHYRRLPQNRLCGKSVTNSKIPRGVAIIAPCIIADGAIYEEFLLQCKNEVAGDSLHIRLQKI